MFVQLAFHIVFPSTKYSSIIFTIILSISKYVYSLIYILFLATVSRKQINQTFLFMTFKTVVDFINPLVAATYKDVSFCYVAANLATTSFQKIKFFSNETATQFTSATKRHYGLWTENLFNVLINIKKRYFS